MVQQVELLDEGDEDLLPYPPLQPLPPLSSGDF
jgi:hypothetical protein